MKSPLVALHLLFVLPLPLERYLNGLLFSSSPALQSNHLLSCKHLLLSNKKTLSVLSSCCLWYNIQYNKPKTLDHQKSNSTGCKTKQRFSPKKSLKIFSKFTANTPFSWSHKLHKRNTFSIKTLVYLLK